MKIFVKVKPNARHENIQEIDSTHFVVSVKEPPVGGQANRAIADALARHFKVAAFRVQLVSGFSSREKVFDIS